MCLGQISVMSSMSWSLLVLAYPQTPKHPLGDHLDYSDQVGGGRLREVLPLPESLDYSEQVGGGRWREVLPLPNSEQVATYFRGKVCATANASPDTLTSVAWREKAAAAASTAMLPPPPLPPPPPRSLDLLTTRSARRVLCHHHLHLTTVALCLTVESLCSTICCMYLLLHLLPPLPLHPSY